jgi:hypothetical protein
VVEQEFEQGGRKNKWKTSQRRIPNPCLLKRHEPKPPSLAERIFGVAVINHDGTCVPVRYLGEQHVKEDLGRLPTPADWLEQIHPERWMHGQRL